jgi:hypothetical protein
VILVTVAKRRSPRATLLCPRKTPIRYAAMLTLAGPASIWVSI